MCATRWWWHLFRGDPPLRAKAPSPQWWVSPSTSVTQRHRLLAASNGVDRYHAALSDPGRVVLASAALPYSSRHQVKPVVVVYLEKANMVEPFHGCACFTMEVAFARVSCARVALSAGSFALLPQHNGQCRIERACSHEKHDTSSWHILWVVHRGDNLLHGPGHHGGAQRLRGLYHPHE